MNTGKYIAINELIDAKENISPLFPLELLTTPPHRFDFSKKNPALSNVNMERPETLAALIDETLKQQHKLWGYGGWGEDRFLYQASPLFKAGQEYRSIHLGIDIWLPEGTSLHAPFAGTVHSFQNNQNFLDYGPTIITEHRIGDTSFYILYGHLSTESLGKIRGGQIVRAGDEIATIGKMHENGNWPSHVHLQLITDMGGKKGDFPGVAKPSEKDLYLKLCPNPESLLRPFLSA
ncbi:MAG TPA: peptidoglycan DD-metalloendopeptidase family protein [Candidatus Paceibacterota bacterium]